MAWKGITDDRTDIGAEQSIVENASYFVEGELRRRPGFGARIAQKGLVVGEFGSYLLYVTSGGDIVSNDGTSSSTLQSGYNVVFRPCLQQALGRMYLVNDFDAMRVSDDGVTVRTAGITAPVSAPAAPSTAAGNVDLGTHLLRYRWYDSRRQRYSDPSDAISVVVSSTTKKLTATNVTTADTTVDTIIWELTPAADASAYYQAATTTNAAGTTDISISDANLVNRIPSLFYGDFGHQPPPLGALLCEHQQYLFSWGGTTRTFTGCTVTNGSPTISGTGFSTQWPGRKVTVTGNSGTYYVSTATTTTITLTANFVGTSSGAAVITVVSPYPDLLCWTQPGQPESWDASSLARRITLPAGDMPAAMISLHGDLYLIATRSMQRMNFTDNPGTNAQIVPVPNSLGAFHQRCVCTGDNVAYGWGRDGIWRITAMQPERISDPILSTVTALMDATQTEARFVVFEPTERAVLFFFCLSGATACKAAAAFYPDSGTWQLWKYRQPMVAGCINNYTDRARLLVCDDNGSSWRIGVNTNDGVDNGVIQAGASSTTTVINGTFTATVGQVVYRPATGEERYITVVGGASITLGVALATTPATGETFYLGSIRERLVTDWFVADGLSMKKRPRYLLLAVRPSGTLGTCSVYLSIDFSSTASVVTNGPSDAYPYGVTPMAGTTEIRVNLDLAVVDGFVAIPVLADWARAVRAEVIHEYPRASPRLLGLEWSITGKPEQKEVEQE